MLYQIYAMTVKDLKVLLRDRGTLITLFVIPIVFILIMSSAGIGGVRRSDDPLDVLVVNHDTGTVAAQAITAMQALDGIALQTELDGTTLTRERAEQAIVTGDYPIGVVFPADFSERVLQAATDPQSPAAVVSFVADPAANRQVLDPIQGAVVGFIQRAVAYAQAPRQAGATFEQMAREAPPEQAPLIAQIGTAFAERLQSSGPAAGGGPGVRFEQATPANYVARDFPTPTEQNVPGYTIFGVFFVVQALATSMLREKQDGTFRRLMAAPLPRAAMLLGKLVPYYLVNLIQVASMFAIGVLVFGMGLGNTPGALVVVTLAAAAAATGLGLMIAALGKTVEQVGGIAALLSIVLSVLGGMMFPRFLMPEFMQSLSRFTPHAWALDGYQDIIVRGLSTGAVLPETGILLLFAAAFFGVALWRFRFD